LASQPVVQIRDANNAVVTGSTAPVTATVASGPGTLTGTVTVNAVSGVATFSNLALTGVGSSTLSFASSGLTSATSGSVAVTPLVLALSQQPSSAASTGIVLPSQPVVQVRDVNNALVTSSGASITASVASGVGTLSGTKTVNAVGGVATFTNLVLTGVGSSTLSFTSSGLTSATSGTVAVTALSLAISTQPSALTSTGVAIPVQPVVQVRDVNNAVVTSSTASITASVATGPGVLTGTKTVSAVAGVASFTNLVLTGVGTSTLSFAATGMTGATSGSIAVAALGITSLSRDGGSAAGGAKVTITGTSFAADATVTFAGVSATSVTFVNATTLNVVVPAGTATNPISPAAVAVSVSSGGVTANFANAWTYWPAPTAVLGSADFESGVNGTSMAPFGTPISGSSLSVTTEQAHGGTQSLKQVSGSNDDNSTTYGGSWVQSDIVGGTGRWHRWFVFFPAATLSSVANHGQIKMFLSRDATNNFTVVGTGPEFRDPAQDGANIVAVNNDYLNFHMNDASAGAGHYGVEPTITAGVWHEIQVFEYRDPVGGVGYTKVWWDGKKIADSNDINPSNVASLAGMGDNLTATKRNAQFGLVYTQNALAYPLVVYIDDISVANGYIDPP
jgi:hypothetical protein